MKSVWIPVDNYIDYRQKRVDLCEEMAAEARAHNVKVTAEQVNRNFTAFYRWHMGMWPLGYVLRQTGLERGKPGAKRN